MFLEGALSSQSPEERLSPCQYIEVMTFLEALNADYTKVAGNTNKSDYSWCFAGLPYKCIPECMSDRCTVSCFWV